MALEGGRQVRQCLGRKEKKTEKPSPAPHLLPPWLVLQFLLPLSLWVGVEGRRLKDFSGWFSPFPFSKGEK